MPAKQILFIFGDSITYGEWDTAGGWANRLRTHYDSQVLPQPNDYVITYNLGIPSETSTGLVQRITTETQARLAPNPDSDNIHFIFAIGANDSRWLIDENKHGVDKETFKSNLELITKKAKVFSNTISFVSLLPCIEEDVLEAAKRHQWSEYYDNQSIEIYNDLIKQHCKQSKLTFMDVNSVFKRQDIDSLFSDGLHPNDKGHALIYETILNCLQKNA